MCIRDRLSTALKDNSSLKFAVITGCLKIAKESIFTGTNNFVSDTISSTRYNEYYGFTQQDVDKLLADAEIEEKAELIKEWYDGYNFGEFEVYCPWDVMNYLRDLQNDLNARPVSYWKNTSDNAIIRSFIDYTGAAIRKKLEVLIAGGSICQKIEEDLTYDYLHSSEDNLWSILYLSLIHIFVGVGSDDVLAVAFMTFFNGKKPIFFPDITYSFYPVWAELFGIPYEKKAVNDAFEIQKEDYYVENGGVVFPNPNAPTGAFLSLEVVEDIIQHNQDVVVIVDEAYIDFGGDTAKELTRKYDNVLVVQTYSKSRSLAGLRIGYAIGNKELIKAMNDVKYSYNSYTMNEPSICLLYTSRCV